jgi:hypothetical protein
MWKWEIQIREGCPMCHLPVYAGPITAEHGDDVIDIGDIIGESMPCPRCGTELAYYVEREWDDGCYVCGGGPADRYQEAEWQPTKQRYRWWCDACTDAFLAGLVGEVSPRLARAVWYPLAWASALVCFCIDIEGRLRRRGRVKV